MRSIFDSKAVYRIGFFPLHIIEVKDKIVKLLFTQSCRKSLLFANKYAIVKVFVEKISNNQKITISFILQYYYIFSLRRNMRK